MHKKWLICEKCGQLHLDDIVKKNKGCSYTAFCEGIVIELSGYIANLIRCWEKSEYPTILLKQPDEDNVFFKRIMSFAELNEDIKQVVVNELLKATERYPCGIVVLLEKLLDVSFPDDRNYHTIADKCSFWCDWGKRAGRLWVPAVKGDIIEVVESHYACECEVGERYVVLNVIDDGTAYVLHPDGTVRSLCFPEEYVVVDDMDILFMRELNKHLNN